MKGFIEKLVEKTFSDNLNSEGLKAIINIARNESTSHLKLAQLSGKHLNGLFAKHEDLTLNDKYLLSRLLFLISIESEAAKIVSFSSEGVEKFVKETFAITNSTDSDDSEIGKVVIELLRYRYNLVHNCLIDQSASVKESFELLRIPTSGKCVNIIGSCLNVCLGNGPEKILLDNAIEIEHFMKILELMTSVYLKNENKDYLGSTLIIAIHLVENNRSELRRRFLPSPRNNENNEYHKHK